MEECLGPGERNLEASGVLVPHAGYVYSGPCAGAVYATVDVPERVVILGPNHTGLGAPLAIHSRGEWETPLGRVPVDESLAGSLLQECPDLEKDSAAHEREHSLEVQLPFLQVIRPGFRMVPVCVGTHDVGRLVRLGEALARVIGREPDRILIVISSDMSHYIPADEASRLDRMAIDRIEAVEPEALHEVVQREGITMCGIAPAVAGLAACRALGAGTGALVCYTCSGERTGDFDSVVAYAGLTIH